MGGVAELQVLPTFLLLGLGGKACAALYKMLNSEIKCKPEKDAPMSKPAGQMTLTLTPELEKFVLEQAKKGAFASASEYVRDLLRDKYLAEMERADKLRYVHGQIRLGLAQAKAGEGTAAEQVFAELLADMDQR
jgi:antitoxin ParD1/3/4